MTQMKEHAGAGSYQLAGVCFEHIFPILGSLVCVESLKLAIVENISST